MSRRTTPWLPCAVGALWLGGVSAAGPLPATQAGPDTARVAQLSTRSITSRAAEARRAPDARRNGWRRATDAPPARETYAISTANTRRPDPVAGRSGFAGEVAASTTAPGGKGFVPATSASTPHAHSGSALGVRTHASAVLGGPAPYRPEQGAHIGGTSVHHRP